jgi:DNA-binding transcriptional LysR family regulator
LRQAQKMEALGQLAGGIAHDFNNHLASIMGHLTLAADRAETFEDPKLERWLEEAQRSSERARDLIRQMLTFGRGRLGDPRILALPALVRDTASLLRASLPATVELHAGIDDAVAPVRADPVQIEQVVMNLAINARDAIGAHGAIRLALRGAEGEGQCASCGTRMAGNYVEICVADDGPGIAPEVAARMFEPFFTTKGVGKGTGMGLATVHALVHEHGGHLRVESAPGAGAAFRVLLPAAAAALAQEAPPPPAPPQRAGRLAPLNGHVLLVDDDVAVLEFMRELVERWGLVSTAVADPLQARDLVAREPYRFDVVVTDQTMPRLSGMDLARAIATMRPDLPVLVCSGYGSEIPASALADAGIRGVLEKPVDPVQLHRRLEACLDMSGTRTTAARRVRLGTSASILTYLLPPLIRSLRAEHPDIELAISTGSAMGLIDRVLRNGIDLGVVTLPVEDRDIEVLRLGEEELVALLPPAAGARTSIGPHEIAQFELVGENKRANLTRVIHAWLERAGAVPRTPMEIDSVEAIKQCVAAGLGAAVVPRSSVEGSNAPAGVCVCSLEPTLTRAIGLIRRRGAPERRELDDVGAVLSRLRDQL